jgi:hypothetical protein
VSRVLALLLTCLSLAGCFEATPARDVRETDSGREDGPVVHGTCATAAPVPLPPEPDVMRDEEGRPLFDGWRQFACEEVSDLSPTLCNDEGACPFVGRCLRSEPDSGGVCVGRDGPGDVPVTMSDRQCVTAITAREKAALCCAYPRSVDCRPWPFDGSSGAGELCAVHADCKTGFVCKVGAFLVAGEAEPGEQGSFGRCVCPELEPTQVLVEGGCVHPSEPSPWPSVLTEPYQTCDPTGDAAWVSEVLGRAPTGRFSAAAGHEKAYVAWSGPEGVTLGEKQLFAAARAIDEAPMTFTTIYGSSTGSETALGVDTSGNANVVISQPVALLRAPEFIPEIFAEDAERVALNFDYHGRPVVAYVRDGSVWVALPGFESFTVGKVSDGARPYGLFVSAGYDDVQVVFSKSDGIYRASSRAQGGYDIAKLLAGGAFDAVVDGEDVLHLAYDLLPQSDGQPAAEAELASIDDWGPSTSQLYTHFMHYFVREDTRPQVAIAASGAPLTSHREPSGLWVSDFTPDVQGAELSLPSIQHELVVDGLGIPHLFVATSHDGLAVLLHEARVSRCQGEKP